MHSQPKSARPGGNKNTYQNKKTFAPKSNSNKVPVSRPDGHAVYAGPPLFATIPGMLPMQMAFHTNVPTNLYQQRAHAKSISHLEQQIRAAPLSSVDWCEMAKDAPPFIPRSKMNIFGDAKPVDTAKKMAEVERRFRSPLNDMSPNYKGVTISDDTEFDVNSFLLPGCYQGDLKCVVIPEGLIRDRIRKLAYEIFNEIGDQPLTMLCVLKGSYRFFTALVDELAIARHTCKSPMVVDFIRAKSYADTESTGMLEIIGLSSLDELKGRNVLIVDDIVDSGVTMSRLIKTIESTGPKSIWTSLLLSKRVPRKEEVPQHFVAFNIPDKFIVGYGLDYNQKFRDLNHICEMSASGIAKYKSK